MLQPNEPRRPRWLLLLPMMLLVGCATTSPISSVDCPAPPLMPAAVTPQPSEPYSTRVERNMKRWGEMLRATPTTP